MCHGWISRLESLGITVQFTLLFIQKKFEKADRRATMIVQICQKMNVLWNHAFVGYQIIYRLMFVLSMWLFDLHWTEATWNLLQYLESNVRSQILHYWPALYTPFRVTLLVWTKFDAADENESVTQVWNFGELDWFITRVRNWLFTVELYRNAEAVIEVVEMDGRFWETKLEFRARYVMNMM